MKYRRLTLWVLIVVLLSALTVTAFGDAQLSHVTDTAGLLSAQEKAELESRAAKISRRYGFGVYIIVVDDYRNYSGYGDIYDCCVDIFERYQLGMGEDRGGTTLMLSMWGRDYALDFNGDRADYAFTETGRDKMEDRFLDRFRQDDFYGGFREYLNCCDEYLLAAENGEPVGLNEERAGRTITSLIPGAIAALFTGIFTAVPMRSTGVRHDANQYIVPGTLELHRKSDMFLHRTVSRRPRQTSSNSGGSGSTHHSSGSHSGRSGKF